MNTVHIERQLDGRLRFTIRSEGERDLSVLTTGDELRTQIQAAEADPVIQADAGPED